MPLLQQPAAIQPTTTERAWCRECPEWNYEFDFERGVCVVQSSMVRPYKCPTAERSREAYNQSLQARRIAIGRSPYSLVARHRFPEEAEINENDAQTNCFDCEPTHQLSCLCWGQNGVPDDCATYNARRAIVEGNPTSRYDIHVSGLSNKGIEVRIEVPMMAVEEE